MEFLHNYLKAISDKYLGNANIASFHNRYKSFASMDIESDIKQRMNYNHPLFYGDLDFCIPAQAYSSDSSVYSNISDYVHGTALVHNMKGHVIPFFCAIFGFVTSNSRLMIDLNALKYVVYEISYEMYNKFRDLTKYEHPSILSNISNVLGASVVQDIILSQDISFFSDFSVRKNMCFGDSISEKLYANIKEKGAITGRYESIIPTLLFTPEIAERVIGLIKHVVRMRFGNIFGDVVLDFMDNCFDQYLSIIHVMANFIEEIFTTKHPINLATSQNVGLLSRIFIDTYHPGLECRLIDSEGESALMCFIQMIQKGPEDDGLLDSVSQYIGLLDVLGISVSSFENDDTCVGFTVNAPKDMSFFVDYILENPKKSGNFTLYELGLAEYDKTSDSFDIEKEKIFSGEKTDYEVSLRSKKQAIIKDMMSAAVKIEGEIGDRLQHKVVLVKEKGNELGADWNSLRITKKHEEFMARINSKGYVLGTSVFGHMVRIVAFYDWAMREEDDSARFREAFTRKRGKLIKSLYNVNQEMFLNVDLLLCFLLDDSLMSAYNSGGGFVGVRKALALLLSEYDENVMRKVEATRARRDKDRDLCLNIDRNTEEPQIDFKALGFEIMPLPEEYKMDQPAGIMSGVLEVEKEGSEPKDESGQNVESKAVKRNTALVPANDDCESEKGSDRVSKRKRVSITNPSKDMYYVNEKDLLDKIERFFEVKISNMIDVIHSYTSKNEQFMSELLAMVNNIVSGRTMYDKTDYSLGLMLEFGNKKRFAEPGEKDHYGEFLEGNDRIRNEFVSSLSNEVIERLFDNLVVREVLPGRIKDAMSSRFVSKLIEDSISSKINTDKIKGKFKRLTVKRRSDLADGAFPETMGAIDIIPVSDEYKKLRGDFITGASMEKLGASGSGSNDLSWVRDVVAAMVTDISSAVDEKLREYEKTCIEKQLKISNATASDLKKMFSDLAKDISAENEKGFKSLAVIISKEIVEGMNAVIDEVARLSKSIVLVREEIETTVVQRTSRIEARVSDLGYNGNGSGGLRAVAENQNINGIPLHRKVPARTVFTDEKDREDKENKKNLERQFLEAEEAKKLKEIKKNARISSFGVELLSKDEFLIKKRPKSDHFSGNKHFENIQQVILSRKQALKEKQRQARILANDGFTDKMIVDPDEALAEYKKKIKVKRAERKQRQFTMTEDLSSRGSDFEEISREKKEAEEHAVISKKFLSGEDFLEAKPTVDEFEIKKKHKPAEKLFDELSEFDPDTELEAKSDLDEPENRPIVNKKGVIKNDFSVKARTNNSYGNYDADGNEYDDYSGSESFSEIYDSFEKKNEWPLTGNVPEERKNPGQNRGSFDENYGKSLFPEEKIDVLLGMVAELIVRGDVTKSILEVSGVLSNKKDKMPFFSREAIGPNTDIEKEFSKKVSIPWGTEAFSDVTKRLKIDYAEGILALFMLGYLNMKGFSYINSGSTIKITMAAIQSDIKDKYDNDPLNFVVSLTSAGKRRLKIMGGDRPNVSGVEIRDIGVDNKIDYMFVEAVLTIRANIKGL